MIMKANLDKLLLYLLKEDIGTNEAAVTPEEATEQGLALLVKGNVAVLVDRQKFKRELSFYSGRNMVGKGTTVFRNSLVGFIHFSPLTSEDGIEGPQRNSTYKVSYSAAEKGYGPLMYDIALSLAYPKFLIPDRASITEKAINVWKFYMDKRSDIIREPLPAGAVHPDLGDYEDDVASVAQELTSRIAYLEGSIEDYERTGNWPEFAIRNVQGTKIEDIEAALKDLKAERAEIAKVNPLDYRYKIVAPVNIKKLRANAAAFVKAFNAKFSAEGKITASENELLKYAMGYFQEKYRD